MALLFFSTILLSLQWRDAMSNYGKSFYEKIDMAGRDFPVIFHINLFCTG